MSDDFKKGDLVLLPSGNKKMLYGLVVSSDLEHDEGLTIFYNVFVNGSMIKIDKTKLSRVI